MYKVKTFTQELKIFKTISELKGLDEQVNDFLKSENVKKVISISDAITTQEGNTIGIIRTLCYEC